MAGKLAHVQALRGVACLLVVLVHLWKLEARFGYETPGFAAIKWFGFAGVDLFFVISGFIITATNRKHLGRPAAVPGYLGRRLWRVYPVYWAATAVAAATAAAVYGRAVFDECTPGKWAHWLALNPAGPENMFVGQAWTLGYEVMFYLAFGVLMLGPPRLAGAALCGWAAAVVALGPGVPRAEAEFLVSPFVLEFLGGCLVAWAVSRGWSGYPRLALAGGVGYAAAAVALHVPAGHAAFADATVNQWVRVAVFGPAAVLIVYGAVAAEVRKPWRLPGWLLRTGDASYSLYLLHIAVMTVGLVAGLKVPHSRVPHLLWLAGTFAATLAVGLGFHAAVERPLLELVKRRKPAPPAERGVPVRQAA